MALLRDGIDAENESFAKLGPKSRLSRKIRHESFVGGLSATRRQEIVDSFQRGEIDVLFYSIDIATGVTLTRSQDMFFVERNWRPADQLQAEDRCHRIGQKNELTITYYDGEGTMDAAMALLLADKVATAAAVVDGANLSEEEALQVVLGEMVQPELPPALRRNRERSAPAMTAEEAASLVDMRRVDDDGNIIDRDGEEDEGYAPSWADAMVTDSWHDPL